MSHPTPLGQPRTPGRTAFARRCGPAIRNCGAVAILLLVLAGCSGGPGAPSPTVGTTTGTAAFPSSGPASSTAPAASATSPAVHAQSSSAAPTVAAATVALKAIVESTLRASISGASIPEQEKLRAALAAAGIPAQNLEVSVSRTPTGLDVDAIEAAARSGNDCVIGQVRDGSVSMTILPVLASGKCFVGDSR